MKYFVHLYHVVRSKVAVEAADHEEAMKKADEMLPEVCNRLEFQLDNVGGCVNTERMIVNDLALEEGLHIATESAEEVSGYMIDEVDDCEYERSANYDNAYRPNIGQTDYGMTPRERDNVLAALRVYDDWRCGRPIDREMIEEIASNGGVNPLFSAVELDALCERINS